MGEPLGTSGETASLGAPPAEVRDGDLPRIPKGTGVPLIGVAGLALALAGILAPPSLSAGLLPAGALQSAQQSGASASLHGTVTGVFGEDAAALAHTVLVFDTPAGRRWVQADEEGRYLLRGLRPGILTVRARHPGYETIVVEVTLPAEGRLRVDLELPGRPLRLDPVGVRAVRQGAAALPEEGAGRLLPAPEIEMQALDLTPGVSDPALAAAVRALPGNDPADATDVLYLRGSTADLKLVLLNGAPVYTPFHVAGLVPGFEPALLGAAVLHRGGAPARYDGGLTHIVDLRTRAPRRDRLRASSAVDLLAASAVAEGPVGSRAGVLASARTLHDVGSTLLGGRRPYGYGEVLAVLEADPGEDHRVALSAYRNSESVLLAYDGAPDDATWSNRALSVLYDGAAGDARLRAVAAVAAYNAALPLQPAVDSTGVAPPPALLATASNRRARLLTELEWGRPAARTLVGISHNFIEAGYSARAAGAGASTRVDAEHRATGIHADAIRLLAPGVTLRAGVRADLVSGQGVTIAPRARLSWTFDPRALLSIAAGRYHQPTRTPDTEVERTLDEVVASGLSASLLPLARADHVVISLDQLLAGRVRMGLSGYWKTYHGLAGAGEGSSTVRSSGVDLRLSSAGTGGQSGAPVLAWLGYSLSWFWSPVDLSGYSREFAGRHLLSTGVSSRVWGAVHGEVRLAYGAGLPYTAIPFHSQDGFHAEAEPVDPSGPGTDAAPVRDSPLIEGLDEDFLRVDLELHARLTSRWAGRRWEVRPYVRILNALRRRDALFYSFQPWRDDSLTPLAARPFLPLIGVAVAF